MAGIISLVLFAVVAVVYWWLFYTEKGKAVMAKWRKKNLERSDPSKAVIRDEDRSTTTPLFQGRSHDRSKREELARRATASLIATPSAAQAPRKPEKRGAENKSEGHHSEHCSVEHGGDAYRVEKVKTGGSIGGKSTEGCAEHYDVRFVKVDAKTGDDDKIFVSQDDMKRAIVLGQMLNDPAFKRRRKN